MLTAGLHSPPGQLPHHNKPGVGMHPMLVGVPGVGMEKKDGMSELQKLVNMHGPQMTPEAMRSQQQVAATIAAVQVRGAIDRLLP